MYSGTPVIPQGADGASFKHELLCRHLQIPLLEPDLPLSDAGSCRSASPERRPHRAASTAVRAGGTTSWNPQDCLSGHSDLNRAGSFESISSRRCPSPERIPRSPPSGSSIGRPVRRTASVAASARHFVSGNRRRFIGGGYDLDLSYITSNVIAMAFPGTSPRLARHPRARTSRSSASAPNICGPWFGLPQPPYHLPPPAHRNPPPPLHETAPR
jgi:hypothetical protein